MAGRTYRYFKGEPLYPFGYGLSYTSFAYANASVSNAKVRANGAVTVSADVTNTGPMDGDEVAELYLTHPGAEGAPIRALAGFQRLHLKRHETQRVSFTLKGRDLSIVDAKGVRRVVPGTVDVWIGGGQPVEHAGTKPAGVATSFAISSASVLPE